MALQEKKTFIADKVGDSTNDQKNMSLSAILARAPYVNMAIVRIDRIEIGASGWWIVYRVGGPG